MTARPRAVVVVTGSELVRGERTDLNGPFLARECLSLGLEPPRIAVGAPANVVVLNTEATWRVREDAFRSRSANSWLLGQTLRGQVRATVAAGRLVFSA